MKRIFLLWFGVLFMSPVSMLHAGGTGGIAEETRVLLPQDSALSIVEEHERDGDFLFAGKLRLEGILLAYWEAIYRDTGRTTLAETSPERTMYLRFYPDPGSLERLPVFVSPSGRKSTPTRVFLYRERGNESDGDKTLQAGFRPGEREAIDHFIAEFQEVPPGFFEHNEGYALQPVTIVLDELLSVFEGNHRFLYARASKFESLSLTDYALRQIPDSSIDEFLGRPWAETFYVDEPLDLRQEPDADSAIVGRLEAGTAGIEKVSTAKAGWVKVQFRQEEGEQDVSGYVRASQLIVIN